MNWWMSASRCSPSTLFATTITGTVAALQHPRDARVFFGDPGRDVDDKQHEVGRADRGLGLRGHLGRERGRLGGEPGFARPQPTAGVDEHERAAVPLGNELAPVAGDARPLFHDRGALADDAVHERRLADVGASDHGNARHDSGVDHFSAHRETARTSAAPSVSTTSTARGKTATVSPSRKTPRDNTTSGSR